MDDVEILANGKMYVNRNFYQGEVVVDLPLITQFNSSSDPNVAMRKGRLVAWRCIEAGEELFLNNRDEGTK